MAYAPAVVGNIIGQFIEKDMGNTYEYIKNLEFVTHIPAHGGNPVHFPHLVFVGPPGSTETRRALVLKTCVHMVIDETADGFDVVKWNIKKHKRYLKCI